MKVALITPWDNAWVPYFKESFTAKGHEFRHLTKAIPEQFDVVLHGWANGTPLYKGSKNIVFMRRYELFDGGISKVQWGGVSDLICVNSWIKRVVENTFQEAQIKTPVHLIYNGTDLKRWSYKERKPNKRIGMACHVHPKKNLPLALQILSSLPEDYELHIAGDIQDPCTAEYLNHLGKALRRRVYLYGHVPFEQLDHWWDQMGFCLSTSLSEGNPNNVIEAMAKGIKPIVHNWPGAKDQFPEYLFHTVAEAVELIDGPYDSSHYRAHVEAQFGLDNIEKVVDLCVY